LRDCPGTIGSTYDRVEGQMTQIPVDVDPSIAEHVVSIRNRFGLPGLRMASAMIETEIRIFEDAYDDAGLGADLPG
jgi:hypothetical protein